VHGVHSRHFRNCIFGADGNKFMRLNALILCLLTAVPRVNCCPGSFFFIHAKCKLSVTFSNDCDAVSSEIAARINGSQLCSVDSWFDRHNLGTYRETTVTKDFIAGTRVTGCGKHQFIDKFDFTLSGSGDSCVVSACSESQLLSMVDSSTNFCNLYNLFCGSESGCTSVRHDLSVHKIEYKGCSEHDASKCLACNAQGTGCCGSTSRNATNALLLRNCESTPPASKGVTMSYVIFLSSIMLIVLVLVLGVVAIACLVKRSRSKRRSTRYSEMDSESDGSERFMQREYSYRSTASVYAN